ncbi:MAG: thiamine ABC transporter substrate-binding protein [bacterium]|nr:thiamine ABC transporter substrate-binding protein [bacterium]
MIKRWFALLVLLAVTTFKVSGQAADVLTLVTHDSFNVSETVLNAFTEQTGIRIEVLRLGDAGALVNQSILSRENPLGDVLYGVDNTFLGRALDNDLFVPYQADGLAAIDPQFALDPEYRVTPINYGDVCLNYDTAYFETNALEIPTTLADLTDPIYRGLLVVQNPATSSPGLAFLMATAAVFGDDADGYTYLDYWRELVANDVLISPDWTDAYYGQFSGAAGGEGDRPLVVSYAGSPPAEVFFAETPPERPPTGAVVADDTCFRQIEFVGILNGTDQPEAAQQWVDFMLSVEFQEDVPLQMFVFPVNPAASLPDVFADYAAVPENPILIDPAEIDENREAWIRAWTEAVLR